MLFFVNAAVHLEGLRFIVLNPHFAVLSLRKARLSMDNPR